MTNYLIYRNLNRLLAVFTGKSIQNVSFYDRFLQSVSSAFFRINTHAHMNNRLKSYSCVRMPTSSEPIQIDQFEKTYQQ